jgi:hypothetical protein
MHDALRNAGRWIIDSLQTIARFAGTLLFVLVLVRFRWLRGTGCRAPQLSSGLQLV